MPPELHLRLLGDDLILCDGTSPKQRHCEMKRILVIGGGITGLTTAWVLLDAGYDVTVVSEKWASIPDRITSQIAGALWEWPPAVCGKHTNIISLEKSKRWCMIVYRVLDKLMHLLPAEDHGVRMRMANFFFSQPLENMPGQLLKMHEIESVTDIKGYKRDPNLIGTHAVNQQAGVVDSYQHLAPVIDTDRYMAWIRALVASKGARFITKRINGDLLAQEDRICLEFGVETIINASGLGAAELALESRMYPLRGALIRVVNDGSRFPQVKEALCVSHDDTQGKDAENIVFIVPRNDRTLVLGGLAQPDIYALNLTLSSPEIIRMRKRCNDFVPGLENAEYDETPLVQGLRPVTDENVLVEREQRRKTSGEMSRIIHSYGQGGSGFSLSFGCATDVLIMVKKMEAEVTAINSVKYHL